MLKLKNVSKYYYSKGIIASGIIKVNLEFNIGEFVAITGESGSGKSTLLNVISGLDTYEEGEMYLDGEETSHFLEKDWEDYRRKNIGNIYQNFNIINSYTVYQNIDLALTLNGISKKERKEKINSLLQKVDMTKFKNTKVSKLSGGQKQRVAIARALAKETPVIIADEPTGSLDLESAKNVIKILKEISKDKLVIIVTHNYDQVKDYVTRKITMHDGKVIEDNAIINVEKQKERVISSYGNIKTLDKIKLGIRNAFNVFPKFVLLFLVYSFMISSLMSEYSYFKKGEYLSSKKGTNYVFNNLNDHRIIINKKDKTSITPEDIENIENLENIDYVIENDNIVDRTISICDDTDEIWLSGFVNARERFTEEIVFGKLPKEDNEIILVGPKNDYWISYMKDKIIASDFYVMDNLGEINKGNKYKIVGIAYSAEDKINIISGYQFYTSNAFLDKLLFNTHEEYSEIKIDFMDKIYISNTYNNYFLLVANNWVTPGTAIISEEFNSLCDKGNCRGKYFSVKVNNIYYSDEKTFMIEKFYNKNNITYTLDVPNYNKDNYDAFYEGKVYINPIDYNQLFNKGTYQSSIFIKDINSIKETTKKLQDLGYNTLSIKDTLVNENFQEAVRIAKVIVTVGLIIALFFISYFVIKVILKSRNIYYAIIRMLGASKTVCRNLLMIELFTICNLTYFIFVILAEINKTKYLNIKFINTVNEYFKLNDYILLYVILMIMSYIISLRYSRKIFKNSVMNTYREEQ